jgi:hypothetical protein
MLPELPQEQRTELFEIFKGQLLNWIDGADYFCYVMKFLTLEERAFVYENTKDFMPSWDMDAEKVGFLLHLLSQIQITEFCDNNSQRLLAWVENGTNLAKLFNQLDEEQIITFCEATKNQIPIWLNDKHQLSRFFSHLDEKKFWLVCGILEKLISDYLKSTQDFSDIITMISIERLKLFCHVMIGLGFLQIWVKNINDCNGVLKDKTKEQIPLLCDVFTNDLGIGPKNLADFEQLSSYAAPFRSDMVYQFYKRQVFRWQVSIADANNFVTRFFLFNDSFEPIAFMLRASFCVDIKAVDMVLDRKYPTDPTKAVLRVEFDSNEQAAVFRTKLQTEVKCNGAGEGCFAYLSPAGVAKVIKEKEWNERIARKYQKLRECGVDYYTNLIWVQKAKIVFATPPQPFQLDFIAIRTAENSSNLVINFYFRTEQECDRFIAYLQQTHFIPKTETKTINIVEYSLQEAKRIFAAFGDRTAVVLEQGLYENGYIVEPRKRGYGEWFSSLIPGMSRQNVITEATAVKQKV